MRGPFQPIPDAPHGFNVRMVGRFSLKLSTKTNDMRIDSSKFYVPFAPHLVQNVRTVKNLSCIGGERPQKVEFFSRQSNFAYTDPHFKADSVQDQATNGNTIRRWFSEQLTIVGSSAAIRR